jgi:hypothetical protein
MEQRAAKVPYEAEEEANMQRLEYAASLHQSIV